MLLELRSIFSVVLCWLLVLTPALAAQQSSAPRPQYATEADLPCVRRCRQNRGHAGPGLFANAQSGASDGNCPPALPG